MCGFTGFLDSQAYLYDQVNLLKQMTNLISHRGPDSEGYWNDINIGIGLGHRRLSIQDLSDEGSQPMVSSSGRYVLVFNGEIYNHIKLRTELSNNDIRWRGHSDTETILACFEFWGIENTVKKCIGMFAFAVWDRSNYSLILCRDRMGEKPLYYGWHGKGDSAVFLFGSELKAMQCHPKFNSTICSNALASFLQNMTVTGTNSIYSGTYKLEPGTLLNINLHSKKHLVTKYWSLVDAASNGQADRFDGSPEEAIDKLENLLKNAVSDQMISDVPLGAFLSGGVDSSAIVALMQTQSSRRIKTFSIGFSEDDYNEAVFAKKVAGYLGTDHTEMYVNAYQAMDVIPKLATIYDEPFADSSQIPTFLVSQMARKQVSVALSGDAGDELFAGYNRYQLTESLWPKLSLVPRSFRKVFGWGINQFSPSSLERVASQFPASKSWIGLGDKLHKGASVMSADSITSLYSGLLATGWKDPSGILKYRNLYKSPVNMPELGKLSDTEKMMLWDGLNYLPDDILTKVDRAAMSVSLETRLPFLDHRVVEFAWRLPFSYKLKNTNTGWVSKWVLRQVLYKYVPQNLIDRPKVGFGVPLEHWLRGPLRDWAEDLLSQERLSRDGFFNQKEVRKKWTEHLTGHKNNQHSIWCILMFQAWLIHNKSQHENSV